MSLREEMAALQDELQSIPRELGFREQEVQIRTPVYSGANADAGIPGTVTYLDTTISPRPRVDIKAVYRTVDGGVVKIGDARVSKISRAFILVTENKELSPAEQIALGNQVVLINGEIVGAPLTMLEDSEWLIDGERYAVIQGGIQVKDLEYVATLKRMEAQ